MEPMILTEAVSGERVRVVPGQHVILHLQENPTTGYRWAIMDDTHNELDVMADTYKTNVPAAGAGGVRVVTIVAPDHEMQLQLRLQRPGNGKVNRSFSFSLVPQTSQ